MHSTLFCRSIAPSLSSVVLAATAGVSGEVRAIFAVAGVWTDSYPPYLLILRDWEGIVRVDEAVPTASLALLSSRRWWMVAPGWSRWSANAPSLFGELLNNSRL